MSLTLNAADIARIGATIPARTRIADPAARELAKATLADAKRRALADAETRAMRYLDYTDAQKRRIASLREVHWPRTRAIRDEVGRVRALLARHADKHDDYSLTVRELEDTIIRQCRLEALLVRAYAASAAIGRFPISLADMRGGFIGNAAYRHFTFAGGRDWGSAEFTPEDIVQGAFLRAIENGDAVDGVPAYGSIFRHVQAERARLTNLANAEYSARKRAALGWTSAVTERERADEYPESVHTLRLLDTRNYATTDDHRAALAIAHRNDELATMDDHVTRQAREDEIALANAEEFHVVLAEYLLKGHALADIAAAIGLTVDTVASRALKSREESMRRMSTGIDHAARSVDMLNAAEREREIDNAQARHAETLRERYLATQTAVYAARRGIDASEPILFIA